MTKFQTTKENNKNKNKIKKQNATIIKNKRNNQYIT